MKHTYNFDMSSVSALSWLFLFLVASGCASSRMESFVDPDFKSHTYKQLLVAARFNNVDVRFDFENAFVERFSIVGVSCRRSVDILLPTRTYDNAEMFKMLAEHGIDGVLMIWETDYWEEEDYVPETSPHSHPSGGDTVRKPRIRHKVELHDVPTRRVAWTGGSLTTGSSAANAEQFAKALAKATVAELAAHGLIASSDTH